MGDAAMPRVAIRKVLEPVEADQPNLNDFRPSNANSINA